MKEPEVIRCPWPVNNALATVYHDEEWGIPVHSDRKHFEFLVLDAFQAGLSWNTILKKRDNFRKAFDDFDFQKIATYSDDKIENLMKDEGIIRNLLKIKATISNANSFIKIIRELGSFDKFIWKFVDYKPLVNHYRHSEDIPAKTKLSDEMSKALQKRGFKFVGSTICYSYMQAAGLINDHLVSCFRHHPLSQMK